MKTWDDRVSRKSSSCVWPFIRCQSAPHANLKNKSKMMLQKEWSYNVSKIVT
jgi:hypothetical protein